MSRLIGRCLRDETGSEVVEYTLLLALLILACVVALSAMGIKVLHRWQRIFDLF